MFACTALASGMLWCWIASLPLKVLFSYLLRRKHLLLLHADGPRLRTCMRVGLLVDGLGRTHHRLGVASCNKKDAAIFSPCTSRGALI
eukprot:258384-Amphidinium_carterae.1